MRSIKILLISSLVTFTLIFLLYDVIEPGFIGLIFVIYSLIAFGVIIYWIALLVGFLIEKLIPRDIQDKLGHALIEYSNSQESESIFPQTSRRSKKSKNSQSRYKAQYRQSTTWWDACPPTFENAAISYAEKYKDNNPKAKVRVVEVIDGKVVGTIYSC